MKRNCNLELRLLTPQSSMLDEISSEKTKKMTFFYKGRVACCDATELQAREIILLASREVEEKDDPPPPLPEMNTLVYSAATGLSMKRSLQRFLEKRKSRAQSMFPYPVNRM